MKKILVLAATLALLSAPAVAQTGSSTGGNPKVGGMSRSDNSTMMAPTRSKHMMKSGHMTKKMMRSKRMMDANSRT